MQVKRWMNRYLLPALCVGFGAHTADGAFVTTVQQVGNDVVWNGSGSLDVSNLGKDISFNASPAYSSNGFFTGLAGTVDPCHPGPNFTGPSSFTSTDSLADSGSGGITGFTMLCTLVLR